MFIYIYIIFLLLLEITHLHRCIQIGLVQHSNVRCYISLIHPIRILKILTYLLEPRIFTVMLCSWMEARQLFTRTHPRDRIRWLYKLFTHLILPDVCFRKIIQLDTHLCSYLLQILGHLLILVLARSPDYLSPPGFQSSAACLLVFPGIPMKITYICLSSTDQMKAWLSTAGKRLPDMDRQQAEGRRDCHAGCNRIERRSARAFHVAGFITIFLLLILIIWQQPILANKRKKIGTYRTGKALKICLQLMAQVCEGRSVIWIFIPTLKTDLIPWRRMLLIYID